MFGDDSTLIFTLYSLKNLPETGREMLMVVLETCLKENAKRIHGGVLELKSTQ